jgi:hypothetical protein
MALPLRGVGTSVNDAITLTDQQIAAGTYSNIHAGTEIRRFSQIQPLQGTRWQFNTPDQHAIKMISLSSSGHCYWCRQTVASDARIGIPLKLQRVNTPNGAEVYITQQGTYCSFECAAAILERESKWPVTSRNPQYIESWALIHLIYKWLHPGKTLRPAPDHTIFDNNTHEAIESSKSGFIPLTGLTFVHVPITYQLTPA